MGRASSKLFYRWIDNDLQLDLIVQPRSSRDQIVGVQEGRLKIKICAPPLDGKANQYLIRYVAKLFKLAPSRIELLQGQHNRKKRLLIRAPLELPRELQEL